MRVYVTQIYIEVGIEYPFSHRFQRWIGEQLSKRITPSPAFVSKYGDDYDLTFNISAKATLSEPEVIGPTVFRSDKDVEYTIFLPYVDCDPNRQDSYVVVFRHILESAVAVLKGLAIDVWKIVEDTDELINGLSTEAGMIDYN